MLRLSCLIFFGGIFWVYQLQAVENDKGSVAIDSIRTYEIIPGKTTIALNWSTDEAAKRDYVWVDIFVKELCPPYDEWEKDVVALDVNPVDDDRTYGRPYDPLCWYEYVVELWEWDRQDNKEVLIDEVSLVYE